MRLFLIVAILICLLAIPFVIVGDRLDAGAVMDFIRSDSPLAALAGIAAMIADLVIPFPAHTIMTNFGMVHGWLIGGLLGATGTFGAGVLAYWLCRLLGQRAVSVIAGDRDTARMATYFERYGIWSIAASRWIPLVPEVVSSLAGATRMAQSRFLVGNLIGSLSVGIAYGTLGSMTDVSPYLLFAVSIGLPVAMLALFLLFFVRRLRMADVSNQDSAHL